MHRVTQPLLSPSTSILAPYSHYMNLTVHETARNGASPYDNVPPRLFKRKEYWMQLNISNSNHTVTLNVNVVISLSFDKSNVLLICLPKKFLSIFLFFLFVVNYEIRDLKMSMPYPKQKITKRGIVHNSRYPGAFQNPSFFNEGNIFIEYLYTQFHIKINKLPIG